MGGSVALRIIIGAAAAVALGFGAQALAGPATDAKIQATRFSVDQGLGGAFAKCAAGTRAVGGGVIDVGSGSVFVSASGPLDGTDTAALRPSTGVANTKDGDLAKQWYAGVSNKRAWTVGVKVLALCSRASDARIQATSFHVGGRRTGHASARCGAGRRVVGGGLVQSNYPDNRLLASGPLDASGSPLYTADGDVAKRWYVAVHNLPAKRVLFKVFALCSADSHATIEATRFSARGGRTAHASAVCPAAKRALGGGIVQFGPPKFLRVLASAPLDATGTAAGTKDGDTAKRWYAAIENRNPSGVDFKTLAICEPG
jgi:hypothetical protein